MFVALRDLRHARGRFSLMLVVIAMITFLVTFLASLTAGLSRESTSAVTDLPADHLAFAMPDPGDAPEFTASSVSADQWRAWAGAPGVASADPLGVAMTRAESATTTASITALGVEPGSAAASRAADGTWPAGTIVAVGGRRGRAVRRGGGHGRRSPARRSASAPSSTRRCRSRTRPSSGRRWTTGRRSARQAVDGSAGPTATVVALTLDERDATVADTDAAAGHGDGHDRAGAQRDQLVLVRERVAHVDAGLPHGDLGAGGRRVLHGLDDQPLGRRRRPQGARGVHRLPAAGRDRAGGRGARARRRDRHRARRRRRGTPGRARCPSSSA